MSMTQKSDWNRIYLRLADMFYRLGDIEKGKEIYDEYRPHVEWIRDQGDDAIIDVNLLFIATRLANYFKDEELAVDLNKTSELVMDNFVDNKPDSVALCEAANLFADEMMKLDKDRWKKAEGWLKKLR
jgi:hypothetical protein